MVDIGRIEVDGLLHPAQAEHVGEELVVGPGIGGHRGNMMQSLDLREHDLIPFCPLKNRASFRLLRCAYFNVGDRLGAMDALSLNCEQ